MTREEFNNIKKEFENTDPFDFNADCKFKSLSHSESLKYFRYELEELKEESANDRNKMNAASQELRDIIELNNKEYNTDFNINNWHNAQWDIDTIELYRLEMLINSLKDSISNLDEVRIPSAKDSLIEMFDRYLKIDVRK